MRNVYIVYFEGYATLQQMSLIPPQCGISGCHFGNCVDFSPLQIDCYRILNDSKFK